MHKFAGPVIGIALGIFITIFRKNLSKFIERFYNKFPKYENGVKTFNLHFVIRPLFVGAFGLVIIGFSVISFIIILD
jgi:hypothetical protein